MIYDLGREPFPDGYTDALLPLALCKQHLGIEPGIDDDDDLIAVLRDAAIEVIERHCWIYLRPRTGSLLSLDRFPASRSDRIVMPGPNTVITAVTWQDSDGAAVVGSAADYRISPIGELLFGIGKVWPSDVGGAISVTYSAGYANGAAPPALLAAARLFLGHLYLNREAIITGTIVAEMPFGVEMICAQFRRVVI